MKKRQSQVDKLIDLLVDGFKKNKNIPYKIEGKNTACKKKNCKKRHGDIVVKSFNKETNRFHLIYYSFHESKPVFEYKDITEEIVKKSIKENTARTYYGKKPYLPVKQLEKLVDKRKISRVKTRSIRLTRSEDEKIVLDSKKKNMEVSDFIRMKFFSN